MSEASELLETLLDAFNQLKNIIRNHDKREYERWKAGGFMLDDTFVSMYPNLVALVEALPDDENEENTDGEAVETC